MIINFIIVAGYTEGKLMNSSSRNNIRRYEYKSYKHLRMNFSKIIFCVKLSKYLHLELIYKIQKTQEVSSSNIAMQNLQLAVVLYCKFF